MKNVILSLATLLTSTSAMASVYDCHSITNNVLAFLVFDDGPGGLDVADLKVYNNDYSNTIFPGTTPSSVKQIDVAGSYDTDIEYGDKRVKIGFTAQDGLKLRIDTERLENSSVFDGTVYVKYPHRRQAQYAFTCTER